jgi:hypothetical protein
MVMFSKARIIIVCTAGLLAGCSTANQEIAPNIGTHLGEATRYNAALQIIDPDPVYTAEAAQPGDRGDMGAAAVKRMRSGQVKQPEVMTTSSSSPGGGNSGPR